MGFATLVKKALYFSGALSLYHRFKNANSLTVVLFHRILPLSDPRWQHADHDWTVSDQFFAQALQFFKKHYHLVSEQDLLNAQSEGKKLPKRALLVTFDDGWQDNWEYGFKIAKHYQIRPLLFVTTGAINTQILSWQEAFYSAWQEKLLSTEVKTQIENIVGFSIKDCQTESDIREVIRQLQSLEPAVKSQLRELANQIADDLPVTRQMMDQQELGSLREQFDLGTHGVEHEPLHQVIDGLQALHQAKLQLEALCPKTQANSMSFPHGVATAQLIDWAKAADYSLIFTGELNHNPLSVGSQQVFGRFNIEQRDLENAEGKLAPEKMALYLFRQPTLDLCQ